MSFVIWKPSASKIHTELEASAGGWRKHVCSGIAYGGELLRLRASPNGYRCQWIVTEPDPKVKGLELNPVLSGWHFYGTISHHKIIRAKISPLRVRKNANTSLITETKIQIALTITGVLKVSENLPRTQQEKEKVGSNFCWRHIYF